MADKPDAPDLDLPFHGLSDADLGTEFETGIFGGPARMPLKALLAHLRATYSSTIGAEFMHITDAPQRPWLYTRLERAAGTLDFTAHHKRPIPPNPSPTQRRGPHTQTNN